jgi:hypothetical protein
MRRLRRAPLIALATVGFLAALLAQPCPPQASANVACDVGGAAVLPGLEIAEAVGIGPGGNPVSEACNAVTDPILGAAEGAVLGPIKEAAASVGKGVFNQVTSWVADGAVWLIGEVAVLSQKTTSPNLISKGFLHEYKLMAQIAALMAALMVIFAVLEALGRGDPGMVWRVLLIHVPLAAIATSAAYVVVQLLLATSDQMSAMIAQSTGADAHHFLQGAVKAIAMVAGPAGSAVGGPVGTVAVPLFIGFIVVVVAAFAAFFVWLELLMRDASVYVVALFMPLAIAASIWPRWTSALRRTVELLIVIVFSKFVIVAIISLAASLLAKSEGSVEHVLAAAVMMLLACFSPFVLFKLVPFAEGAVAAAYGRQSAASGGVRTVEFANSMMMVQRLSRANWAAAQGKEGHGGEGAGGGGSSGGGAPDGPTSGGAEGAAGGEAAAAGGAAGAGAAPIAAAVGAAKATREAGERLGETGEARAASESHAPSEPPQGSEGAGDSAPRPQGPARSTSAAGEEAEGGSPPAGDSGSKPSRPSPEPSEAPGGRAETSGASAPRPASTDSGGEAGAL